MRVFHVSRQIKVRMSDGTYVVRRSSDGDGRVDGTALRDVLQAVPVMSACVLVDERSE